MSPAQDLLYRPKDMDSYKGFDVVYVAEFQTKPKGFKVVLPPLESMKKLTKNTLFVVRTGAVMASVRFKGIRGRLAAKLAERNTAIVNGGGKKVKRSKDKQEEGFMAGTGNRFCRSDVTVGR